MRWTGADSFTGGRNRIRGSQLTYCVEVAAELLADVEEQTVRSVHQAQRPDRKSFRQDHPERFILIERRTDGKGQFDERDQVLVELQPVSPLRVADRTRDRVGKLLIRHAACARGVLGAEARNETTRELMVPGLLHRRELFRADDEHGEVVPLQVYWFSVKWRNRGLGNKADWMKNIAESRVRTLFPIFTSLNPKSKGVSNEKWVCLAMHSRLG